MLLFKQERGELLGLGSVPENAVDNCRPATEGDTVETSREMDLFWVDGRYQGIQIKMLVDSGSSRTMISENRYLDLWKEARPILKTYSGPSISTVNGERFSPFGSINLNLEIGTSSKTQNVLVVRNLALDFIIGGDYLWENKCILDYSLGVV